MLRSALLLLSGHAAASALLLVRNLLIARLIPVEDYGIAATFAIAMAVVEMASQLGLHQQIVQSKDGDDPRFQAALQGFQVLRGLISGLVLFLAAGLFADFLNIPEAAWAYQVMAVVPVLKGLSHFDIHRLNRERVFWPVVLTGAVPALVSVLAVWPLVALYGDYRVMLWAIVLQAVMTAVTSHLVARRPYRLVLDRAIMGRSLRFGWPLLLNGILLFAVFNGDKMIVGRVLGMETLAIFAMGFTLTLTPAMVLSRSVQNLFLPDLSAAANAETGGPNPRFAFLMQAVFEAAFVLGIVFVLAVIYLGPPFVRLVLPPAYEALIPLLPWLAVAQSIRIFKVAASVTVVARARTAMTLVANLPRVLGLPVAWWAAVQTGDVILIVQIILVSELAGFALALVQLKARLQLSLRPILVSLALSLGAGGLVTLRAQGLWPGGVDVVLALWCLATFASMRAMVRFAGQKLKRKAA